MTRVRGLVKRVRRLELARAPRSPFERAFGTLQAYVAEIQAGIDAGKYDRVEMPLVLNSIIAWHSQGLWGGWQRQGNQFWAFEGR